MKAALLEEGDGPTLQFPQISRDKGSRIFTRKAEKLYRVVFDKRVVTDDGQSTRPFGS